MVLSRLTKITGPGIRTDTNWVGNNANYTGILTAASLGGIGNITATGIITASSFSGNVTAVDGTFSGNVSIAGTLTYEDVTNIDSVGIITAPALDVDDFVSVGSNIHLGNAGVVTATSFVGDGSGLIGVASTDNIITGTAATFNTYPVDINAGMTVAGVSTMAAITVTTGTFSGAIDLNADLDVDGHTNLDNVSIAGLSTHSEGIFIPDDKSIRIGNTFANPDLKIASSSSSEQVVIDYARSGSGKHLRFRCTDLMFENYNGLTKIARFQGGVGVGHAELYYAGNKKFETTVKGIQVGTGVTVETNGQATFTGIVTASTYYGDGSNLSNITSTTINNNANNRLITGSGTANTLEGESTLTYDGTTLNLADQKKITLGDSSDLKLEHDGGNSFIDEAGTGKLLIRSNSRVDITSTSNYSMIEMIVGGAVNAYHDGNLKLQTTTSGITVTGGIQATGSNTGITCNTTNSNITFTSSGSNANLNHYATGSNSQIKLFSSGSNSVYKLDSTGSNGLGYLDGLNGVRLYHGGNFSNQKLTTTSTGITVTGTVAATAFSGDGSSLTGVSAAVSSDSEENVIGGTDAGAALDSDTLRNTFIGHHAGKLVNSGDDNVFVGHKSGDAATSAYKNVGVGAESLPYLTSGYSNVCVGWEAGRSITSANKNTCIGDMAGRSMSGTENIAIGYHAYSNGGGTRCIGMMDGSVWLGGTDVIGIGKYTMARGGSQTGGIGLGYYAGRNNVGD